MSDANKLNELVGKVVGDVGAAMSAALVLVGDELGLWRALAASSPLSPAELATRTGTHERYIREWLNAMAASGYVVYGKDTQTYRLEPEHAVALADPTSSAYVPGLFQVTAALWAARAKIAANFRSGAGLAWSHQHPALFEGTERVSRARYIGNLVEVWLPALDGVVAKLERGGSVADVGCGVGASTIMMAAAFPRSRFVGFDSHAGSIELARQRARAAGVAERVTFEVASASDFTGTGYDVIAHLDCFHDLADPAAAARYARAAIAPDGTWLVVEPFAHDLPEDNHNAIGRVFYSTSTMVCIPHALAHGGTALGAQAGEQKLREHIIGSGWRTMRRAAETPFSLVLEARP